MAIHIGKLIQKEVEIKRLTYREFGELIHRNEKTIPDIYDRASMSIDLLVNISAALKKDFLNFFYSEEPLKSLRNDEVVHLNNEIQNCTAQIQKLAEENKLLQRELTLTQELTEAQKETISFAKEQIEHYKLKLTELVNKYVNKSNDKTNEESANNAGYTPESRV
jgi:predicted RNase H-like nuclease (RuvC/YqgF family)